MAATCGDQSLLTQLSSILDSDPLIDELGFLHSSQFASLEEINLESSLINRKVEKSTVLASEKDINPSQTLYSDRTVFWCVNHKLAISISVLPTLYEAAKSAFLLARREYGDFLKPEYNANLSKLVDKSDYVGDCYMDLLRDKIMAYSRVLIIINSDYKSAWNARREVLGGRMTDEILAMELRLSSLSLSYNPKSEESWAYRRWAITQLVSPVYLGKIPESILQGELKHVGQVVEISKMNYRAWRHCCWLVQYMSPLQATLELKRWKAWAQLHFADNCCWHFRRCLLQHITVYYNHESTTTCISDGNYVKIENEDSHCDHITQLTMLFQDELEWNKNLLTTYAGCEALWMHRRFLFGFWLLHIRSSIPNDISCHALYSKDCRHKVHTSDCCINCCCMIPKEMELVNSWLIEAEKNNGAHRQQVLAATYKLWILLKLRNEQHFSTVVNKELVQLEDLLKTKCPRLIDLWEGLFRNISA